MFINTLGKHLKHTEHSLTKQTLFVDNDLFGHDERNVTFV